MPARLGPSSSTYAGGGIVASWINSILDAKAAADGVADDTAKLQAGINSAAAAGHHSHFFQPGQYKVSGVLKGGGGATGKVRLGCVLGTAFIRSTVGIACSFVGSIANAKLTVSAISAGALCVGCNINYGGGWTTINAANSDGTWSVTETVTVAAGTSMLAGAPIVLVGSGDSPSASLIDGEVFGLNIAGPAPAPTSGSTGIMLVTMRHIKISQCEVNNTTAGYDMVGNCYGSSLEYCRAGFGGTCMVGWHLRGVSPTSDAGAGNQVSAYQSWLCGVAAGVQIGPGADGVALRDGQIGATGTDDAYGNRVIGRDYYTGRTGGVGVVVEDNVDGEGFGAWRYRIWGPVNLFVRAAPTLSNSSTVVPWGLARITGGGDSHIEFIGISLVGKFRSTKPIVIDDDAYPNLFITEFHTSIDPNSKWGVSADGTGGAPISPAQCQSLVVASALKQASFGVYSDWQTGQTTVVFDGVPTAASALVKAAQLASGVKPNAIAGLSGWYSADRILPAPAEGGAVASWADRSGVGGAATQATTANQPLYRSVRSSIPLPYTGAPVLQFNGSSTSFNLAQSSSIAMSAVVVAAAVDFTNASAVLIGPNDVGGFLLEILNNNGVATNVLFGGADVMNLGIVNASLDAGEYYVFGASYANPGAWIITLNGVVIGSGTSATTFTASRTLQIGMDRSRNPWKGGIAEAAVYNSAKAASDLASVSFGLMRKYGIAS